MSDITMVKVGNDPAGNVEVTQMETGVSHSVGDVQSNSAQVSSFDRTTPKYFQKVPQNPLGDFLSRLTEISQVTIDETDLYLTSVVTLDPWTLFLANPAVMDKTKNFSLIRGVLEVVIVSAMPGSCYGSYCWSALADGMRTVNDVDSDRTLAAENCMQVDHYTRVDCANSENCVLQLPWIWPYDYAQVSTGPDGMWSLNLICLSPIGSGLDGGLTTGTFKVYARLLPGYELVIPHYEGKRKGALAQSSSLSFLGKPGEHKVSNAAKTVASVASALSVVPVIGEFAAVAGVAAGAVAQIADWFGFTREGDERHPLPTVTRSVTNVAHVDGMDSSEMAALSISNSISIDPTLVGGTELDVMSNASLFSRWTVVSQHAWSPSDEAGSNLLSLPVTPFFGRGSGGYIRFPVAGYVGLPFNFWRGDMEYLVVIPVSKFHRGSLQIYWSPYGSGAATSVTNTTLNMILDVSTNVEQEFVVGYARDRPYLQKAFCTNDVLITQPTFSNGFLNFRVVNPLISQSSTAAVNILIFARAGANMDFAFPWTVTAYPFSGTYKFTQMPFGLSYEGGALGDEQSAEQTTCSLVESSGAYPGKEILWGENVSSVRALMQKPSRVLWASPTVPTNGSYRFPLLGMTTNYEFSTGLEFTPYFTYQGWYRVLFTGIACSERFKFMSRAEVFIGVAPVYVPAVLTSVPPVSGLVSSINPMSATGPGSGYEVSVPYYNSEKYLLCRRSYNPLKLQGQYRYNLITIATKASAIVPEIVVYHSYGPDIRVNCFRQVPLVRFTDGSASTQDPFWQYNYP